LTNEKDNYSLLEKRILKVGSIHTCDKLYLNTTIKYMLQLIEAQDVNTHWD